MNEKSIIQESMLTEKNNQGKTTIAPEVLLTIVQLTTLDVEGVYQMSNFPGADNRFLKRVHGEGVRINIEDDIVNVDLYIILENNVNIRETGLSVQRAVERAINKMVGMKAGRINIHVEDIYYPDDAKIE